MIPAAFHFTLTIIKDAHKHNTIEANRIDTACAGAHMRIHCHIVSFHSSLGARHVATLRRTHKTAPPAPSCTHSTRAYLASEMNSSSTLHPAGAHMLIDMSLSLLLQ